ncbi:MAG: PKD domain-containing protein [Flavobacteriales bacterium]|nr:PKD domain-containing protein [Flavobacteriales bacterium]MDW8409384.1 PKD domain-containing protein [Flavobacteriales bacterium]
MLSAFARAQCPPTFTYTLNGLQVVFNNQPNYSFPQASLLWNFGDGTTLTNQNDPSHTYASTGSYTVCLTVIDPACAGGQPQVVCQTVQVTGASCLYDFTFTISGNAVSFNNTPQVLYPASLSWNFGEGSWSWDNDPVHFYNTPGIYTACMTVNDPACGSQPIVVCHQVDMSQADTCVFTISYVANGLEVQFFNTPQLPDTAITWYMGDGVELTGNNPQYTYWFPGTYFVCATAQMPHCLTNMTQTACDSVEATVPDSCTFSYTYTVSGLTVSFQADPPLEPPVDFFWDFGDLSGFVWGNNSPVHTFAGPGTYYVCLYADNLPCSVLPSWAHCEYITVTQPIPCTASFGYTITGLTVHFYNQPAIGSGAPFSLQWNFGDGGSASGDYPIHTYSQPGSYVVCLTYIHPQCPQPYTVCDTVIVTGATNCNPLISHAVNGLTVQFFNNPDYIPSPGLWFQWIFGDGFSITGVNDPVHTYLGYGNYVPCFLVFDHHCSDTVQVCDTLELKPASALDKKEGNEIWLYPNPGDGQVWINLSFQGSPVIAWVSDLQGRVVAKSTFQPMNGIPVPWDLHFLAPGVYSVTLETPDGRSRRLRFLLSR